MSRLKDNNFDFKRKPILENYVQKMNNERGMEKEDSTNNFRDKLRFEDTGELDFYTAESTSGHFSKTLPTASNNNTHTGKNMSNNDKNASGISVNKNHGKLQSSLRTTKSPNILKKFVIPPTQLTEYKRNIQKNVEEPQKPIVEMNEMAIIDTSTTSILQTKTNLSSFLYSPSRSDKSVREYQYVKNLIESVNMPKIDITPAILSDNKKQSLISYSNHCKHRKPGVCTEVQKSIELVQKIPKPDTQLVTAQSKLNPNNIRKQIIEVPSGTCTKLTPGPLYTSNKYVQLIQNQSVRNKDNDTVINYSQVQNNLQIKLMQKGSPPKLSRVLMIHPTEQTQNASSMVPVKDTINSSNDNKRNIIITEDFPSSGVHTEVFNKKVPVAKEKEGKVILLPKNVLNIKTFQLARSTSSKSVSIKPVPTATIISENEITSKDAVSTNNDITAINNFNDGSEISIKIENDDEAASDIPTDIDISAIKTEVKIEKDDNHNDQAALDLPVNEGLINDIDLKSLLSLAESMRTNTSTGGKDSLNKVCTNTDDADVLLLKTEIKSELNDIFEAVMSKQSENDILKADECLDDVKTINEDTVNKAEVSKNSKLGTIQMKDQTILESEVSKNGKLLDNTEILIEHTKNQSDSFDSECLDDPKMLKDQSIPESKDLKNSTCLANTEILQEQPTNQSEISKNSEYLKDTEILKGQTINVNENIKNNESLDKTNSYQEHTIDIESDLEDDSIMYLNEELLEIVDIMDECEILPQNNESIDLLEEHKDDDKEKTSEDIIEVSDSEEPKQKFFCYPCNKYFCSIQMQNLHFDSDHEKQFCSCTTCNKENKLLSELKKRQSSNLAFSGNIQYCKICKTFINDNLSTNHRYACQILSQNKSKLNQIQQNKRKQTFPVTKENDKDKIIVMSSSENVLNNSKQQMPRKQYFNKAILKSFRVKNKQSLAVQNEDAAKLKHVLTKYFICHKCKRSFRNQSHFDIHIVDGCFIRNKTVYYCRYCSRPFAHITTRIRHEQEYCSMNYDVPEKKVYNCPKCNKQLMHQESLQRHMNFVCYDKSQELKFQCTQCPKMFAFENHVRIHFRRRHNSKFVCNYCNRSFSDKYHLERHILGHSGVKPFQCDVCGTKFSRKCKLKDHISKHSSTAATKIVCKLCGKKLATAYCLNKHMTDICNSKNVLKKPFICDYCKLRYASKDKIERHIFKGHMESYTCKVCQKSFGLESRLNTHMKRHMFRKSCKICKETFDSINSFIRHKKCHKDISCSCGQIVTLADYKKHRKYWCVKTANKGNNADLDEDLKEVDDTVDTSEDDDEIETKNNAPTKEHLCKECGKGFATNYSLSKHLSKVCEKNALKNPFVCDQCKMRFATKNGVKQHILKKHVDVIKCDICEKSYKRRYKLIIHIKNVHKSSKYCKICQKTFPTDEYLEHKPCMNNINLKDDDLKQDDINLSNTNVTVKDNSSTNKRKKATKTNKHHNLRARNKGTIKSKIKKTIVKRKINTRAKSKRTANGNRSLKKRKTESVIDDSESKDKELVKRPRRKAFTKAELSMLLNV